MSNDPHYIKATKRTTVPLRCMFVDTETRADVILSTRSVDVHTLRLWCATLQVRCTSGWHSAGSQSRRDGGHFWDFVDHSTHAREPLWLFSHNLGFDLTVLGLWHEMQRGRYETIQHTVPNGCGVVHMGKPTWKGAIVLEDPPTIIEFRLKGTTRTVVCVDTMNYWRVPLSVMGQSVDRPKMEIPAVNASDYEWELYCWRDVEIIERSVIGLMDLVQREKLGPFQKTAPAMAMSAFKSRFMRHKILVHKDEKSLRLERDAYFGGDCRVFRQGVFTGKHYHLDVRSLYPSVMASCLFPSKLVSHVDHMTDAAVLHCLDPVRMIADVFLVSEVTAFPVRHDKRMTHAMGHFRTTLCGHELARAVNGGHVKRVYRYSFYHMDALFDDFINHFWHMRYDAHMNGCQAEEQLAKLLMNGLAGKFGQKGHGWEDTGNLTSCLRFGHEIEVRAPNGETDTYRYMAGRQQRKRPPSEGRESIPSIAAFITMYGRERMRYLRAVAGGDNVLYQDTDSLIVSQSGMDALENDWTIGEYALGALRIEDVASRVEIIGQKQYIMGDKRVIAGIKPKAIVRPDGRYQQDEFQRLGSVLDHGAESQIEVAHVVIDPPECKIIGTVGPDGWVAPIRLSQRP